MNILDRLVPEPGAIYVMDRGYIDFERLGRFHSAGSFFVIRAKRTQTRDSLRILADNT